MESLLFACDLVAVAFLCRWALAEARREEQAAKAPPAPGAGQVDPAQKNKPN